jgi:hypothetical protein
MSKEKSNIVDTSNIILCEGDIVEFEVESGNTIRYWQGEVIFEGGEFDVYVPGDGL